MPPRDALAEFQAALVDLLAQDLSVDEVQRRLAQDAAFAEFREYVQTFEPRMLEVAALLVKKWGKRTRGGSIVTEG